MPQPGTIATHPDKAQIDAAIVAGVPNRRIATQYDVSEAAVRRYKADGLPVTLVRAKDAEDAAHADDLLAQVRDLQSRALAILDTAEAAGELRTALAAIREARGNLELLARLLGELQEGATVNLLVAAPEWLAVRGAIFAALAAHPDARAAVAHALTATAGDGGPA